jgi:hypothetical protein
MCTANQSASRTDARATEPEVCFFQCTTITESAGIESHLPQLHINILLAHKTLTVPTPGADNPNHACNICARTRIFFWFPQPPDVMQVLYETLISSTDDTA